MTTLLSNQGPLAHVWLASNYDKKLSKLQFLNTDIVSTSNLVSSRQLSASSADADGNTITLRLSGQLLLGIVRIYLRKTKYLLDDVHETLYKLKNSFKVASGASLGPLATANVNLPPQRTTLSNPARIQLQDQVTDLDLFYQEDLVLDDDEPQTLAEILGAGAGAIASELDRLMEVGRGVEPDVDFDLDLDFDLDVVDESADQSIEQGRDAQVALADPDQSLFDLDQKPPALPEVDMGAAADLAAPNPDAEPLTPESASTAARPERRPRAGVDNGVIRTAKRKLVIDSAADLERGIPNSVLREIQSLQLNRRFTTDVLTVQLSALEKLALIEELAEPMYMKRRKIGNLDEQLRRRCLELSLEEQGANAALAEETSEMGTNLELDLDTDINFDLSLPDLESDRASSPEASTEAVEGDILADLEDANDDTTVENLRATAQVAGHLRDAFFELPRISFNELIQKDINMVDGAPLGATSVTGDSVKVSERREATKCFFELLVLASQDCITLEQPLPEMGVGLPENPSIRPRDNLVSKFL
ncbi:hypothetical protein PUMCH_004801 [Australozyma saopauloensis]|uniref:Uncharacterized protein n=1 Tax=Australozyma saopauloensis TaxID=291208 RepID=A0AAX4HG05_9ASCO|nr:hypothetical protein PUMCH_004801 [[Candida] saopauloensis]